MSATPTNTVTVPSGNTVTIKVIGEIPGKYRKLYLNDMNDSTKDPDNARSGAMDDAIIQQVVFRHVIAAWSYEGETGTPLPIPTKELDTTDFISVSDIRAIWDSVKDMVPYLSPSFEPTLEEVTINPKLEATTVAELAPSTPSGTLTDTTTEAAATTSVE
jgi:hypothetical protein